MIFHVQDFRIMSFKTLSLSVFLGFLYLSILSSIYVSFEDKIYYWDYLTYYTKASRLNILYHSHPLKGIGKIFSSIWKADYNYFPAVIPSFFITLTQNHRQIYIQTLILFYCMPFCIFFTYIFSKIFNVTKTTSLLLPFILTLTNTAIIGTILRGFPDVGGMAFIECALILALSVDYSQNIKPKKAIYLGLFLWGAFLFRRWYAYTIVSLYISLPIFNYYYFNSRINAQKICNLVKNFCLAGVSSIFMLLACQFGLLRKILKTDYSVVYSAYQKPLHDSINAVLNECGIYLLPAFALGLIFIIFETNKRMKLYVSFCLFNLLFSIFLFFRTQSPDMQHIIPFSFWMMMIAAYGLQRLFHAFQGGKILQAGSCVLLPAALLVSLFCTRPYQIPVLRVLLPMQLIPLRVDTYQTYQNLVDDLEHDYKPHGDFAILSSSPVLNTSIVNNISDYRLITEDIAHVDLRDSDNWTALNTKYVVVVSPVQTHLPVSHQRMVTLPAHEILNHVGIGANYEKVGKRYELRPNVYAYIYEKTAPFSQDQIADFNQKLYSFYPDWKKKGLGYKN